MVGYKINVDIRVCKVILKCIIVWRIFEQEDNWKKKKISTFEKTKKI